MKPYPFHIIRFCYGEALPYQQARSPGLILSHTFVQKKETSSQKNEGFGDGLSCSTSQNGGNATYVHKGQEEARNCR